MRGSGLALVISSTTIVKFRNFVIIDLKITIKWDLTRQMFQDPSTIYEDFFC